MADWLSVNNAAFLSKGHFHSPSFLIFPHGRGTENPKKKIYYYISKGCLSNAAKSTAMDVWRMNKGKKEIVG